MIILPISEHTKKVFRDIFKKLAPPPNMRLSEWADKYRKLSQGAASMSGQWNTAAAPYQREIMDSITDITVVKTVVMSCAQIGKTDAFLLNTIGYYCQYDPSPIMVMQPTLTMAESFSKDRLAPMFRDTPVLSDKVKEGKASGNTILHKVFAGGYVTMVGSNSPQSLASRPIRILLADEIDRYPASAGNEGDPLFLAGKRQETFWNAKEIDVSTPTIKNASRIEVEFLNSSRGEWHVPCPVCGEFEPLTFAQLVFDKKDLKNIRYCCSHCGTISTEVAWREEYKNGQYIHEDPSNPVKGYHLNALASTLPGASWRKVIEKFLKAQGEAKKGNLELLKAWTNTEMGQTWEEQAETLDDEALSARREEYEAEVPAGGIVLTCGVDTQDDRLEYEIVAWGLNKESWGIKYGRIYGDTKTDEPWLALDDVISQKFKKPDGVLLHILCTCIDSGGHRADMVYKFCKARTARRVFAIRGGHGPERPFIPAPTKNNRYKTPLFTIGVDTGKSVIADRLKIKEPGGGYCHFGTIERGYDDFYFKMLTAEKQSLTYKKGKACYVWELKDTAFKRNEAFDIRNYATAALEIASPVLKPKEDHTPPAAKNKGGRRVRGEVIN